MLNGKKYDALNGLRSLACLGIVAMHVRANFITRPSLYTPFETVLNYAGDFVLLFMMVSTFSLCCGYFEKFQNNSISLDSFYSKRYKRILPFFALLSIVDFLLCAMSEHFHFTNTLVGELWEFFANVTLVFGLVPGNGITVIGVGWFLGVIFLFYLLFPFFCFLLATKKRAWLAFGISIVWFFAIKYYFVPVKHVIGGNTNMLVVAPFFLAGGLVYLYKESFESLMDNKSYRVIFACITLAYTVAFFALPQYRFTFSNLLLYVLWLMYAVAENQSPRKWTLLNNKVMAFISAISMEIYLSHMLFFRVVEKAHLDRYVHNSDVLYYLTLTLVLLGAVAFSFAWKKFEKRFVK